MEARSLSSLNHLAANPPQYPVNPTQESHGSLTLYISRVPGTRDVILSTFKPGLKNVTAEDVASSLYYIHHELPSENQVATRRSSEDTSSMSIRRKPLPADARPITPESLLSNAPSSDRPPSYDTHLTPDPLGISYATAGRPRAATTGTDSTYSSSYLAPPGADQVPPRRPLGPRDMNDDDPPPPPLPPRPSQNGYDKPPSPKKLSRTSSIGTPFALTLIRRDPSSGAQWNVGRIASHQLEPADLHDFESFFPPQPMSRLHSSSRHPAIDIRMDTSGYAKFRNMPRRSNDVRPATGCAPVMPPIEDMTKMDGGVFSRQVVMSYTRSWTSKLSKKLHSHKRGDSVPHVDSSAQQDSDNSEGLKPRGYVFTSPWDGLCDFRTGNGGRSLRCHHSLNDGTSSSWNPLVEGGESNASSAVVSELRFNLPNSELFSGDRENADKQCRGNFGKFFRQDPSSDESLEMDDRMAVSPFDVHVGREKAGGGNRGTRAKLGKLIVHNEGLKMLDLVVAANIGVWWGSWERSF